MKLKTAAIAIVFLAVTLASCAYLIKQEERKRRLRDARQDYFTALKRLNEGVVGSSLVECVRASERLAVVRIDLGTGTKARQDAIDDHISRCRRIFDSEENMQMTLLHGNSDTSELEEAKVLLKESVDKLKSIIN